MMVTAVYFSLIPWVTVNTADPATVLPPWGFE